MEEKPNLRPKLNRAEKEIIRLLEHLEQIEIMAKREPDNLSDADAILTDILEEAQEALK